ncbi:MAG: Gfo/Idh/MocA family oxidoreductase [Victivallales bacterium]|nr:Gfo/Idh/MocA family oxidoreductase [Victivallales bacterium]
MPDGQIRIGIVGAGGMANSVHIPSLLETEGVEIAAICDLDLDKAKVTAEKFSIPNVHRFHTEMLEKETLDGVYALVEPDRICRPVMDSLRAGCHVFCEKPPGLTAFQAATLARVAKESKKNLMVAFNRRFIPLVQEVVKIMRNTTEITRVHGRFHKHGSAAFSAGLTSSFPCDAIHAIDLVRWIAAAEPVKAATIETQNGDVVPNAWESIIRFENGVVGTISSNYMTAARVHTFELHGTEASAFIDLGFGGATCSAEILLLEPGKESYSLASAGEANRKQISLEGKKIAGSDSFHRYYGFYNETLEFISSVKEGRKPSCDIEEGLKALELTEFILGSKI